MDFVQDKITVVFLSFILISASSSVQDERANISKQDCTKLLCSSKSKSIESRCRFLNESTVMIDLEGDCLCVESLYTANLNITANNSRINSTSGQKETRSYKRQTAESYILVTYCFVASCLLLEVFVFAVLYLCARNKRCNTRPEVFQAENTETIEVNPIYQPGPRQPQVSQPLPMPFAQEPYQPLGVGNRGPGESAEYRGLLATHRVGVTVDQTDYQDLEETNQAQKYQYLVAERASEHREYGEDYAEPNPSSVQHLDSLRSLAQSAISPSCGTSSLTTSKPQLLNQSTNDGTLHYALGGSEVATEKVRGVLTPNYCGPKEPENQMHRVIEELEAGEDKGARENKRTEEPLYYVLEGPSPGSSQDPLYSVIKELRALNPGGPEKAPSSDSNADPQYYVLENPDEAENKNAEEDGKL